MRVCILGENLTSLTLAKALSNLKIHVDIVSNNKKNRQYSKSRSLGISSSNEDFLSNQIVNVKKLAWKINNIEIYTDNFLNKHLFNFEKKDKHLFSIIKNFQFYRLLKKSLKNSRYFKKKKSFLEKRYNLIINTEFNNELSKKYFSKKIEKDYEGIAYTTILKHKKILNNKAVQIFTKLGPIAYLPLSNYETSVVYSLNKKKNFGDAEIKKLIKNFNRNYKISKIGEIEKFKLKSYHLRSYYNKNILAFGDLLHKIHPLAGQGFNMTLRDIQNLTKIIKKKISLGLPIDSAVCEEFENTIKHKNFIFSQGIDFIYEFFKFERKTNNLLLNKSINFIGKNKSLMNTFSNIADSGDIIKFY